MKSLYVFFVCVIFFVIFKNWFFQPVIIGGDWPYFFHQRLLETTLIPPSWNTFLGNGFGGLSPFYSLQVFHHMTIFVATFFHIPWEIVYKVLWFGLFLCLCLFSSLYLFRIVTKNSAIVPGITAGLIYTTNTYILMVVGGGQMGVGLGYAICPLVVGVFIKLLDSINTKNYNLFNSLLAGVVLAVQVMFDPRISYLSLLAVGIYGLLSLKRNIRFLFSVFFLAGIIPVGITLLLHAPWLSLILFSHISPASLGIGSDFTGVGAFTFFSFADFSHSFSLLQPNWPDNIFGKTGFLLPQFLLLPIIVYSALFFIQKDTKQKILFFCFVGLVGTFLAKGANMPFGGINSWMFESVPGFVLFRDPTKFYTLTALSYAVLIPYTLLHLGGLVKQRKIFLQYASFFVFLLVWIYLIAPAVFGKIDKTLAKNPPIPQEYKKLEHYLQKQPYFFRTLWVPRQQRFSFISDTHPAVEAQPLLQTKNASEVITRLQKADTKNYLQRRGIKYVIVPYDPYGEIFFKDRKYDNKQYEQTIQDLRKITWLSEIKGFGKLAVFELKGWKNHFWISGKGTIIGKKIQPDEYTVYIVTKEPVQVIFTESYHRSWIAAINGKEMNAQRDSDGFNTFFIEKAGTYKGKIFFKQKETLAWGWYIFVITAVVITLLLVRKKIKNMGLQFK